MRELTEIALFRYPFSEAMISILATNRVRKGWIKIKSSLSDKFSDDELESALKELIEAGFVEYNVQTHELKFID